MLCAIQTLYIIQILACPVTLNNASDYRANRLLSDYIGWTNGLRLGLGLGVKRLKQVKGRDIYIPPLTGKT